MKQRTLRSIALTALAVLMTAGTVRAGRADLRTSASLRPTPFLTRSMRSGPALGTAADGIIQAPALPDTLRVLAIRVDFETDTLSTTTGDGHFLYQLPDSIAPEDWIVDPPPHDSTYFADQLLAMRTYFKRYSRGKLTITGALHQDSLSGGDIFPRGERTAYHLPYPIWHINWGNDDDERLNRMLVKLFVDAWKAADDDPAVDVSKYDLFVIFHAGAGNEFDTGYDTTPHDIPSVFIGPEDLQSYSNYPDGIPMRNGRILKGVILPETQRQDGIEVGLVGTVCHQIGYLIGMPHLYNTENGDPGIGLFGLMDRGFGGFFGLIPTPPSAWMRAYMGWDSVTTVPEGEIRLGALQLPDSAFGDSLDRLVRVPINDSEYFLLESRMRDPNADSMTVAYDREGRQMRFHDDYTIDADPGFRVGIRVEDQDFDLPASGILIWHIDDGVIRDKLATDQLENDRNHRAVSLMEADGTEDIGEDYAFLQAGDGSEYGVREDAWYQGNELWRMANKLTNVTFSPTTAPSTVANNGGASQLAFSDFSPIGERMSCLVYNPWKQGDFPATLPWPDGVKLHATFGNLDGDSTNELIVYGDNGVIRVWRGDGSPFVSFDPYYTVQNADSFKVAVADVNGDGSDEIVIATDRDITTLTYNSILAVPVETSTYVDAFGIKSVAVTGEFADGLRRIVALYAVPDSPSRMVRLAGDMHGMPEMFNMGPGFESLVNLGEGQGTTVAAVSDSGRLALLPETEPGGIAAGPALKDGETVFDPISADFDGDGDWDVAALTSTGDLIRWWGSENWQTAHRQSTLEPMSGDLRPVDVDGDGIPEVVSVLSGTHTLVGVEVSGVWSEGTPLDLPPSQGTPGTEPVVVSLGGADQYELIVPSSSGPRDAFTAGYNMANGRPLTGFPLDYGFTPGAAAPVLAAGQLDTDPDVELVALTSPVAGAPGGLKVYNLPSLTSQPPLVLWGTEQGDPANGRHLATPATGHPLQGGLDTGAAYVWPNPVVAGEAHLRFRSGTSGTASVKVFDLVGRRVLELSRPFMGGGDSEITFDVSGWPSGVYVARLEAGGKHALIRFAVVK